MDTTMANHPESIREHPDRRKKTPNREEVRRESGGGWGRKETHLPDFKNIEKKTNKTIQEMSTWAAAIQKTRANKKKASNAAETVPRIDERER